MEEPGGSSQEETLAEQQGADIYEIVPEQPYMDEDLNYNDRTTCATAEQNDPDAQMGEGLSVHYSGGNSLPDDVAEWLESNGINGSGK